MLIYNIFNSLKRDRLLFIIIICLCICNVTFAQTPGSPNIYAGTDQVMPCNQSSVVLSSVPVALGATDSYSVTSIPYLPPFPFSGGTPLSVNVDDVYSPVITLPFNFCFFGQSYNKLIAGSNGVITFDTTNASGYCPWSFTTSIPSNTLPVNSIFGAYFDMDPSVCGNVYYEINGTFPFRTFVFKFDGICYFSCNSMVTSQEIVLYEATNIIEVYIANHPVCSTWNTGNALIGIQNFNGTVGFAPPGRNTGPWTATNEAWRFTPNGTPNYITSWWQGGLQIDTGTTVVVTPAQTTTYTAQIAFTNCDGSVSTDSDQVIVYIDTLFAPEICMVTVDSLSLNNLVYWDKTMYNNIDSFIVYRETNSGVYQRIGSVLYDSLSFFIDTVRNLYFPYTGDPNTGPNRYKLQIVDSCGNYSTLGNYHSTIYLTNSGGVFNWNDYTIEGEAIPITQLSYYNLMEDTNSTGYWHVAGFTAPAQLTITEPGYASYPNGRWRIETQWSISCTPYKSINTSCSNFAGHLVGISENGETPFNFHIYPNPFNFNAIIEITGFDKTGYELRIVDLLGNKVFVSEINFSFFLLNRGKLQSGVYIVQIVLDNEIIAAEKAVIQ